MTPFIVKVKSDGTNLFLLQVPNVTLNGEPFYAMLLGYKIKEGWVPALYDAKAYYDGVIREMRDACTEEHMNCLHAARAYIGNLIWLAEMQEIDQEIGLA